MVGARRLRNPRKVAMSIQTEAGHDAPGARAVAATDQRVDAGGAARGTTGGPVLPLWAALGAAVVGGVAMDTAFPSLGWWPLAFLAVPLALVSLVGRRLWGSVLVGVGYGAGFFFPHVSWAAVPRRPPAGLAPVRCPGGGLVAAHGRAGTPDHPLLPVAAAVAGYRRHAAPRPAVPRGRG